MTDRTTVVHIFVALNYYVLIAYVLYLKYGYMDNVYRVVVGDGSRYNGVIFAEHQTMTMTI